MSTLTIRDPYGNTFEIDTYARPYWEGREGYTILPEPEPPAEATAEETTSPKPSKKAAPRPASEDKE